MIRHSAHSRLINPKYVLTPTIQYPVVMKCQAEKNDRNHVVHTCKLTAQDASDFKIIVRNKT